jgi:hypothetical protein
MTFIDNINLDSSDRNELIGITNMTHLYSVIQEYSEHSMELIFRKKKDSSRIPDAITYKTDLSNDELELLVIVIESFTKLFNIKIIAGCGSLDDSKIDYVIGLFILISSNKNVEKYQNFLSDCSQLFSPELMFKFLLLIKGFLGFSKQFQLLVHKELVKQIKCPNGFSILCKTLLVQSSSQNPTWKICETIAKIASVTIQGQGIGNVFKTLKTSILNDEKDVIGACVCTLGKIHEKNPEAVEKYLIEKLEVLVNPEIVLQGAILMEHDEIRYFIDFFNALFSGSIASLPSKILLPYLNLLYHFYLMLPDQFEKHKLSNVIVFCLSNRDAGELKKSLEKIVLKQEDSRFFDLHPKVVLKEQGSRYSVQIGQPADEKLMDSCEGFVILLKRSNNNLLVYQIFLASLDLFQQVYFESDCESSLIEGSIENDEFGELLSRKFFKKLTLLELITNLVQLKSLHAQFNENPKEILSVILKILEKSCESGSDDTILMMLFSIYREFVFKLKNVGQQKEFLEEVKRLKKKCKKQELRDQIDAIFDLKEKSVESGIDYEMALNLLGESETYCKVYGLNLLIKLLEKKDSQAVANKHSILAIALKNLREPESYSFLNVIRLLVVLANHLESEVVDSLIQEYQNRELDVDERLKIGEAILKVTELMGEISYKYKDVLINCFLAGSRDRNDEFRASSLANLGAICRILTFQIHKFFQELHLLLESIITTDSYLPSKRAAVMVLSQTLTGLDNLMDIEEHLLPIYRLLKNVLAQESDPQTRIHAEIGLEHLQQKTKKFLQPERKFEKEIKIFLDEKDKNVTKDIIYK